MANNDHLQDFDSIKARLEEIVEAVNDESIPLDDALDLYEEAVELGMRVSDVLEDGIVVDEEALAADELAANSSAESEGNATEVEASADAEPAAPATEAVAE